MALNDIELGDWTARLRNDPALAEAARLLAQSGTRDNPLSYFTHVGRSKSRAEAMQPTEFLRESRDYKDLPHDYRVGYDEQGQPDLERKGFMERNPWVGPALAAAPAGAWLVSALAGAGPAAATGGGGGAASSLPGPAYAASLGSGAAGGAGSWLAKNGVDLARLGLAGAGAVGAVTNARNQPEIPPELKQLLQMQMSRMQSSEPLYQAVLQLAQSRMPRG